MKTTLEIIDIVWQHLNNSSLKTAINGAIWKATRPAGSTAEDVVINSLFANSEQVQSCIVNVNIYAPDKKQTFDGVENNYVDYARLRELTAIAVSELTEVWDGTHWFDVQQQVGPIEDENNQHYINIRVNFFNENL